MTKTVAVGTNKYGETVKFHETRHGIRRVREPTPLLEENSIISALVKKRIAELRRERGWTLKEAARRYGFIEGDVKQRAWSMENMLSTRNTEGMRLGTIYHVAAAYGMDVRDLLPSSAEITAALTEALRVAA